MAKRTNENAQHVLDRTEPHYRSALLEVAANEVLLSGSVKRAAKKAKKTAKQARSADAARYFADLAATIEGASV